MRSNLASLLNQAETGRPLNEGRDIAAELRPEATDPPAATLLDRIVNAVLYEGYILYPYRPSSQKNQRQRFTFGRVYPSVYSDSEGGVEACMMQTECLFQTCGQSAKVKVTAGFLQPIQRQVWRLVKEADPATPGTEAELERIPRLEAGGKLYQTWMEAVEREVVAEAGAVPAKLGVPFMFGASETLEPIADEAGEQCGAISRRSELLEGTMEVEVKSLAADLFRITVRVINHSPMDEGDLKSATSVLHRSFASTHIALEAGNGAFVSLLDPPEELKSFADDCKNIGLWPVLVGDESRGDRQAMLASPIILYDYPKIAPESAGNFFDGTEIDEMLTLRVLTMTDAEKREMQVDDFSRQLLERTHALDADGFLRLHGVMREANTAPAGHLGDHAEFFNPSQPVRAVSVGGAELRAGDRVSISPKRRADAMDLMLAGKTAIIEALEQDAEGNIHLALVLEDDPGRDLGMARQSGHRFFYGADEVKPLRKEATP